MKEKWSAGLDWFCLIGGVVLLVLTILSNLGVFFVSERDYTMLYAAEVLLVGSTVMRILRRKTEIVEEVEEEE